jgi:hypothetical protein
MVGKREARLEATEAGLKPVSEGWFAVNVRDTRCTRRGGVRRAGFRPRGATTRFWRELPWV